MGGICVFIYGQQRDKVFIFFSYGAVTLVAGLILFSKHFAMALILFVIAAASLAVGLYKVIGRYRKIV